MSFHCDSDSFITIPPLSYPPSLTPINRECARAKEKEKKKKKVKKEKEEKPAVADDVGEAEKSPPAKEEPRRAQRGTSNVFALFNQAQIQEFKEVHRLVYLPFDY